MTAIIWRLSITALLCLLVAGQVNASRQVAVYGPELPPYLNPQHKEFGVVYALLEQAMSVAGYDLSFVFFPKLRVLSQLHQQNQSAGLILESGTPLNPAYLYSQSLLKIQPVKISLIDKQTSSLDVAVVRGAVPEDALASFHGRVVYAGSVYQAMKMLELGRVGAVVVDSLAATEVIITKIPHLAQSIQLQALPATDMNFRLAVPKNAPYSADLISRFNDALLALRDSSVYDRILARYGLLSNCNNDSSEVTLRIATVDNADMIRMQQLSSEFEAAQDGMRLEWHVMDESDLHRRVLSNAILGYCQYDVITVGSYQAPIWAERGWLTPLEDLPQGYDLDDLMPSVKEVISWQGSLYALPFYAEGAVMFYRNDLMVRKGLRMPEQPSWQDIRQIASRLDSPDRGIAGICLRTKPDFLEGLSVVTSIIHSSGGAWFDQHWQPTIDSQGWRSGVELYLELIRRWGPKPVINRGFQETLNAFAEGECAMWMDATVAAGSLYDASYSKVAERVAIARAPMGEGDIASPWLWVWALAVPVGSSQSDEAIEFVSWATSKTYIERVQQVFGLLATPPGTRLSTYRHPAYLKAAPFAEMVGDVIQAAGQNTESSVSLPYHGKQYVEIPEYTAIGNETGWNIYQVLLGQSTLDQAIEQSQRFSVEVMRRTKIRGNKASSEPAH